MAADPSLPPITCPSSLVASCPPLLGFTPEESLVALILGVPGRAGPVLMRVDLPSSGPAGPWADEVAQSISGTGGRAVDLVAWIDAPDGAPRRQLRSTEPMDRLVDALLDRGVHVAACLSTNGRVCWSHDCPDELCCGGSQSLDPEVVTQVQAEYVYAGFAPLARRTDLAVLLEPDLRRTGAVAGRLAGRVPPANPERWRDVEINYCAWLLVPGGAQGGRSRTGAADRLVGAPVPVRVGARVVRALGDVRVRDVLLRRLIVAPDRDPLAWQRTTDLLADVVRCAPSLHRAPAATLLGIVAWMTGHGALATLALDAAEEAWPGYRLAGLTREVIARGTDPAQWRASMAVLSEAECRGRGQASTRTPSGGSGAPEEP